MQSGVTTRNIGGEISYTGANDVLVSFIDAGATGTATLTAVNGDLLNQADQLVTAGAATLQAIGVGAGGERLAGRLDGRDGAAAGEPEVDAGRVVVAVEVDIGEWFGKADRYQVQLYHKELESGFFSSGNFLEQGTQKSGVRGSFTPTERDSLKFRHDREDRLGAAALPGAGSCPAPRR